MSAAAAAAIRQALFCIKETAESAPTTPEE